MDMAPGIKRRQSRTVPRGIHVLVYVHLCVCVCDASPSTELDLWTHKHMSHTGNGAGALSCGSFGFSDGPCQSMSALLFKGPPRSGSGHVS